MKNNFTKQSNYIVTLLLMVLVLGACSREDKIKEDPYSGGKKALGISFSQDTLPVPDHGNPGEEVTYRVHGLQNYTPDEFTVYLHQEEAEVTKLTDSTLTIKVPAFATTGELMLDIKNQVFFGPSFEVDGKIRLDETFLSGNGANSSVKDMVEKPNSNLLLVGSFTNYDLKAVTQPINRIALTTINGKFVSTLLSGKGANGIINSIAPLPDGKYMIAGGFSAYNVRKGINNMTRLNKKGSLDSMVVDVVAMPDRPGQDTVPAFNGGVSGSVEKIFTHDNKVIALGNFKSYGKYLYDFSTYDDKFLQETKINQIVRMDNDGTMDSSYNYDEEADQPYPGGNGRVNDGLMLRNGELIVAGSFSKFDNMDVGGIVKIKQSDGLPDASFNSGGSGADGEVSTVNYNKNTKKFILTGNFNHFNGKQYNGMVMLNEDGTVDDNFKLLSLEDGKINFAAQLDNGLIIVSGTFKKYDHVIRTGFMILNPDGTLAEGYNNTGDFQGQINKIYETRSALGRKAVLLMGYISQFNSEPVNNIVRIEIQP